MVRRIVCATDPGYAVNPAQIERQIAGSFVYGLSAVFMEECTVKNGAIEQTNFTTFDSMKIAQMPKGESIIMPSGGFWGDRKSTRLNSSHLSISYAVFCFKKKKNTTH